MILALTLCIGLALFSVQIAMEWLYKTAEDIDALRWHEPRQYGYQPHPEHRVISKA
jgi:hypothetical protein